MGRVRAWRELIVLATLTSCSAAVQTAPPPPTQGTMKASTQGSTDPAHWLKASAAAHAQARATSGDTCKASIARRDVAAARYAQALLQRALSQADEAAFSTLVGMTKADWVPERVKSDAQGHLERLAERRWGPALLGPKSCDALVESRRWMQELKPKSAMRRRWRETQRRCLAHWAQARDKPGRDPVARWLIERARVAHGAKAHPSYLGWFRQVVQLSGVRWRVRVLRDCGGLGAALRSRLERPIGRELKVAIQITRCGSTELKDGRARLLEVTAKVDGAEALKLRRGAKLTATLTPETADKALVHDVTRKIRAHASTVLDKWAETRLEEAAGPNHERDWVLAALWSKKRAASLATRLSGSLSIPAAALHEVLHKRKSRPRLLRFPKRPYLGRARCDKAANPNPSQREERP